MYYDMIRTYYKRRFLVSPGSIYIKNLTARVQYSTGISFSLDLAWRLFVFFVAVAVSQNLPLLRAVVRLVQQKMHNSHAAAPEQRGGAQRYTTNF